ncbi:MAG TPA: ParB/RepB/Spo0J family partition protein [Candidatus Nesterenkonia stercoripullorum]|uniref:ParB/RepB/Spo0J family partition protein n=1 Tax=Candidatus Nesterenkonia stercoripullorum TaxID=2838701 RepID=A0A9D1UT04_9MICC|nr:ParB/RepB/Spo0J family partition protein [Galactobacter sp.]HIW99868.1 ParB/RepB/Spo0J family partition protein [Candidatus Nesterenkonia stercoripullorum]
MAEKRRGLGRGLGALIASGPVDAPEAAAEPKDPATSVPRTQRKAASTPQEPQKASEGPDKATKTSSKPATKKRASTARKSVSAASASDPSSPTESSRTKQPEAAAPARRSRPSDMFFTSTVPADDRIANKSNSADTKTKRNEQVHRRSVPDVLGASARARSAASAVTSASAPSSTSAQTPSISVDVDGNVASPDGLVAVPGTTFAEIETDQIHPNRKQPRQVFDEDELDELVTSIKEVGLLQPIVVRTSHEADGPKYELVMGERRWRATQAAGLSRIPAIIRETEDGDLLRDALLENLHRSQLNPLEEAAAYQQLMDEFACTQDELSARIGRSRPQISNTIRLLRLPALVQRRVAAGVLSAGHARALLTVEDPESLEKLAQRVVNEGLSVRATEEAASLLRGEKPQTKGRRRQEPQRHERLDHLANSLQDRLDTNVKITLGARKGKVQIEFASVEDLDRIMNLIGQEQ